MQGPGAKGGARSHWPSGPVAARPVVCGSNPLFPWPKRHRSRRHAEGIGEAGAVLGSVLLEEREDRLDHAHRAAGADLVLLQLGEVGENRLMHQAGTAAPMVFGSWLGEHRDGADPHAGWCGRGRSGKLTGPIPIRQWRWRSPA